MNRKGFIVIFLGMLLFVAACSDPVEEEVQEALQQDQFLHVSMMELEHILEEVAAMEETIIEEEQRSEIQQEMQYMLEQVEEEASSSTWITEEVKTLQDQYHGAVQGLSVSFLSLLDGLEKEDPTMIQEAQDELGEGVNALIVFSNDMNEITTTYEIPSKSIQSSISAIEEHVMNVQSATSKLRDYVIKRNEIKAYLEYVYAWSEQTEQLMLLLDQLDENFEDTALLQQFSEEKTALLTALNEVQVDSSILGGQTKLNDIHSLLSESMNMCFSSIEGIFTLMNQPITEDTDVSQLTAEIQQLHQNSNNGKQLLQQFVTDIEQYAEEHDMTVQSELIFSQML
ncbi:hypothetical protein [Longirhabdus pacifica]|uniref:hypothetical protein n=1 Tax=Longirhabdus pacifica TaxID=2305227 RepID=UPI0010091468|nr:hypothetical protein [Longirhabdus pacifica]